MSETVHSKPETATKTTSTKRRGRQTNKIAAAFASLTSAPVAIDDYARSHGVSTAVLRQAKRFDKTGTVGQVRTKTDKSTGQLLIWRDNESV